MNFKKRSCIFDLIRLLLLLRKLQEIIITVSFIGIFKEDLLIILLCHRIEQQYISNKIMVNKNSCQDLSNSHTKLNLLNYSSLFKSKYYYQIMIIKNCIKYTSRFIQANNRFFARKKEAIEEEETTAYIFYRQLLRNTKAQANGLVSFDASQLHHMINLTKQPSDCQVLLEAFYNFHGHYTKINNGSTDKLVQKYLKVGGAPDAILQLYKYHNYLHYFPHYNTTNLLLDVIKDQPGQLKIFLDILRVNKFIKINKEFIKIFIHPLRENLIRQFIQIALQRAPNVFYEDPILIVEAVLLLPNKLLNPKSKIRSELIELKNKLKNIQDTSTALKVTYFCLYLNQVSDSLLIASRLPKELLNEDYWNFVAKVLRTNRKIDNQNFLKLKDEYTVLFTNKGIINQSIEDILAGKQQQTVQQVKQNENTQQTQESQDAKPK